MKRFPVSIYNHEPDLMGIITRKHISMLHRNNYILISDNSNIPNGYKAVILESDIINSKPSDRTIIIPENKENLAQINDGDVINITNELDQNYINLIYQKYSDNNVIMATERCNASCVMCPQPKVIHENNKLDINLRLISLMDKETCAVAITGGEPTLIGDDLFVLISKLKKKNIKIGVVLLSNGIKFDDINYVEKLAKINHPNLLIDIPLYSDIDTLHNNITGSNGFYKTVNGLYNLSLYNQRIGIRVVVSNYNYKRLYNIAEFIYHNFPFVFHVAFMQMEITGFANTNINDLWIDPYNYQTELQQAIEYLHYRFVNVSIYNSTLCVLPKPIWKFAKKSISTWKNIYLDDCDGCEELNNCGGFFESVCNKKSDYIKPIKYNVI